jgi:hypothetical protein
MVTDQIVSLDGADMVSGSKGGMSAALDRLGRWLTMSDSVQKQDA